VVTKKELGIIDFNSQKQIISSSIKKDSILVDAKKSGFSTKSSAV